jgi:hypothetical protein
MAASMSLLADVVFTADQTSRHTSEHCTYIRNGHVDACAPPLSVFGAKVAHSRWPSRPHRNDASR